MVPKFIDSKQKIKIVATPLCLGNISKDWSVCLWFIGQYVHGQYVCDYVGDFSVDYDAITVDDILDIHNYLMKKNDIV